MQRFLVRFAYDGSLYQGWQKQREGRTVQGELEQALSEIAKTPVITIGSSRTDAGVHALNQYAHFDFPVNMTPEQIRLALTTKLSKEIKIIKVYPVSEDFNARFRAMGRAYRFVIAKELTPFNRLYKSFFPRYRIDKKRIEECLPLFKGRNDFELFCQNSDDLETFISIITHCAFYETEEDYIFEISADRFLHNMVRRIVGTLVRLSTDEDIYNIIKGLLEKKREFLHLVYTAPPQGLYLVDVIYPERSFS